MLQLGSRFMWYIIAEKNIDFPKGYLVLRVPTPMMVMKIRRVAVKFHRPIATHAIMKGEIILRRRAAFAKGRLRRRQSI